MHPVLAKELEQTQRRADCFNELVRTLKDVKYWLNSLPSYQVDEPVYLRVSAVLAKAEGVSE